MANKTIKTWTLYLITVTALIPAAARGGQPSFMGLGDLPGGLYRSLPRAVSGDGTTVVGLSNSAASVADAFVWRAGTMTSLNPVPGWFLVNANSVSWDGSVIVGSGSNSIGENEAFRWENGAVTGLGFLPGGTPESYAWGVSADGSVVVGSSSSAGSYEAFRWENGVMTGLGELPGGVFFSAATDVSHDGSAIVGQSISAQGYEATAWFSGVITGLGFLPGGAGGIGLATRISADGNVVVGNSPTQRPGVSGSEAFRWENGVMVGLGDLPGGSHSSWAWGVSADGSIIVGSGRTATESEAIIWDAVNGMRPLEELLTEEYGLDLTGWDLIAWDISDDGLTIVGGGPNPNGDREAWIAHIVDCDDANPATVDFWNKVTSQCQNLPVADGRDIATVVDLLVTGAMPRSRVQRVVGLLLGVGP